MLLVLRPDVGDAGPVPAEDVVVGQRVAEEVRALGATADGLLLVGVAHEGGDTREVGVDRVTDRHRLARQRPVVVGDPLARLLRVEERERERADAELSREVDGVPPGARHPHGRVRALVGLGHDVARWDREDVAAVAGERRLGHAAQRDLEPFAPLRALVGRLDAEPPELGLRRRFARAQLDPSAREEVERRDALGDAHRMVERRRHLHDPVPEPESLGAL